MGRVIQHCTRGRPGAGQWIRTPRGNAVMRCPSCEQWRYVRATEVALGGSVRYRVSCTRCPFHDWVVLDGWGDA